MLIPCDEVNILNTFRVMIILRLLLLLTNLHLKLLSTQGTGVDKLLSTQRVKRQQEGHIVEGNFGLGGGVVLGLGGLPKIKYSLQSLLLFF